MTQWLISLVAAWGYIAIFITMVGESAGLPISSEIVVPLGGALASQSKLGLGGTTVELVLVVLVSDLVVDLAIAYVEALDHAFSFQA